MIGELKEVAALLARITEALEKLKVAVETDKRYFDSTLSVEAREIVEAAVADLKTVVKLLREKLGLPKEQM